MMYHYFVSGAILLNNGNNSFFNSEITVPDKISSFEEVLLLLNKLALNQKVSPEAVTILNYQLLRIE